MPFIWPLKRGSQKSLDWQAVRFVVTSCLVDAHREHNMFCIQLIKVPDWIDVLCQVKSWFSVWILRFIKQQVALILMCRGLVENKAQLLTSWMRGRWRWLYKPPASSLTGEWHMISWLHNSVLITWMPVNGQLTKCDFMWPIHVIYCDIWFKVPLGIPPGCSG